MAYCTRLRTLFDPRLLFLTYLALNVAKVNVRLAKAKPMDIEMPINQNSIENHQLVDCGSIVSNITNVLVNNPQHPEPTYTGSICETVIERASSSVDQLSIKFRQLELYRPSYDGECLHDRFAIYTALNVAVTPVICGIHNGETIRVPFGMNQTSLILSIITSDLDHDRLWSIEVSQE